MLSPTNNKTKKMNLKDAFGNIILVVQIWKRVPCVPSQGMVQCMVI
jgi:hypothetical protein